MKRIGEIVLFHRKQAGLSRIECADLAGVGKTAVYDIEQGKDPVQFRTLRKVLDTLNISIKLESPMMKNFLEKETKETSTNGGAP